MKYDRIRQMNIPYLKAYEYVQDYKRDGEIGKSKWFKDPTMIKEWQPFYRTIQGRESTLFVIEVDIRTHKDDDYYLYLDGKPLIHKTDDPLFIREIKLMAGLDFIRKFQERYPQHKFFIKTSGQGYHLIQEVKGDLNPRRFLGAARYLFSEGWEEKTASFSKFFNCNTKYGKLRYKVFIDKLAGFRYGMLMWTYSPYWKIPDKTFYSVPVKDNYTITDILKKTIMQGVEIEPYFIPEFEFKEYLLPEEDYPTDRAQKGIRKREQRLTQTIKDINIPNVGEKLPYHFQIKLKEMINLLNSDWRTIAPAIRNAYRKICVESGHYQLRILLVHALANLGFTPEDIALLFRFQINDERDNYNPDEIAKQVLYYYGERSDPHPFTYACKTLQDIDSAYYCCDPAEPCSRTFCLQPPLDLDIVDHDREFEKIYSMSEFVLGENTPNLIELSKTTRSGVTTSMVIKGAELDKRVVAFFPTRKICDDTYPEALQIALERDNPIVINGAVVRANTSACQKLIEKVAQYSGLRKLHYVAKPPCLDEAKVCKYWTQTYETPYWMDGKLMPIGAKRSLDPTKCTLATIFQTPDVFDSIALTYSKMRMLIENNKLEISNLKEYLDRADVIIMDEFSQFSADIVSLLIRETRVSWTSDPLLPAKKDTYTFFQSLEHELFILEHLEEKEGINEIIQLVTTFLERFLYYQIPSFDRDEELNYSLKVVDNPLSSRQRMLLAQKANIYHSIIEKIAQDHKTALSNIERLLGFLQNEKWLATNITSIFVPEQLVFIAKPANQKFIKWIRELAQRGTKIITTDATLPLMSSSDVFDLDFHRIDAGDPMDNNEKQLIIADSRNISVIRLVVNRELQRELIDYINNVIEVHGTENIRVVTPNKNSMEMVNYYIKKGELPVDLEVTYVRSALTVGVKSDKRIMVLACAPFTPQGSHLANAYYQVDKFINHPKYEGLTFDEKVVKLSQELREHEMAGHFYQTIGRAKDPIGEERSVVYCWGMRKEIIETMFKRISINTVVPTIYDTYVRFNRTFHAWVGKYWKEKSTIVPPIIGKIIDYILNTNFQIITTRDLWKRLNVYKLYSIDYQLFHDIIERHKELIEPFAIIQNKKTKSKKLIKKPQQNI